MTKLTAPTFIVFASFALASCGGGGSEEARERQMEQMARSQGIEADVELDDNGSAQVTINGATVGTNMGVPDDFPEDVFVDPSWNVTGVNSLPGGLKMVQAMTDANADTVIGAVEQAMIAYGWEPSVASKTKGPMASAQFEKDGRMAG